MIDLLHNKLIGDNNINLDTLDREIDQTENGFLTNGIKATFPTFGKEITQYLNTISVPTWKDVQTLLDQLNTPTFYLKTLDFQPVLSLVRFKDFGGS